ncbi:MAG: hypothetical protein HXX09_15545 [Bacteroidetes bacterium]|nr:hypothetical protein [Bacteroidota bacterium]
MEEQLEELIDTQIPTQKIYKDHAMWVGSMLGGPLTAGYIIAENFKAFNERGKARKTWFFTIIATIVIFGSLFLIADNVKLPNQIIPLIYTGIGYFLMRHFQGEKIKAHINANGKTYSWWRVIGISIIGLVTIVLSIVLISFITPSEDLISSKTFGKLKHEIVFNQDNISENEVNQIADGLTKMGFFDETQQKSLFVSKDHVRFLIRIPVMDDSWNEPEAVEYFNQFRKELQRYFPNNKIVIEMGKDDNIEIVKKRIE